MRNAFVIMAGLLIAAEVTAQTAPVRKPVATPRPGPSVVPASTARRDSSSPAFSESLVNARPRRFPVRIPKSGAVALQVQILLDRANFSPGIIDGAWGNNAARALAFFTGNESGDRTLASTARATTLDQATYDKLRENAGSVPLLVRHRLSASDLRGPYLDIPKNVYLQAKLRCLCYSSAVEALAERFHTSPKLLAQLNPKVRLEKLAAGATILIPNVDNERDASRADTMIVARLVVSRSGFWTQAQDPAGHIIYHFPSTLGGGFDPSPLGEFKVNHVAWSPSFRYQPKLFSEVPDSEPEALLPPGPNSPVGEVWISLSKPHYGIHGTSSPETIGYATSHGCVRLTNWDARQLGLLVEGGIPVIFK